MIRIPKYPEVSFDFLPEVFPYDNYVSMHITIKKNCRANYMKALSLMQYYINAQGNIITRHTHKEIRQLLIAIDLGFAVISMIDDVVILKAPKKLNYKKTHSNITVNNHKFTRRWINPTVIYENDILPLLLKSKDFNIFNRGGLRLIFWMSNNEALISSSSLVRRNDSLYLFEFFKDHLVNKIYVCFDDVKVDAILFLSGYIKAGSIDVEADTPSIWFKK